MRVSYSAISQYNECGYKYKLNRIDKIRPNTKSSAFIFGGAIDAMVENLLLKFKGVNVDLEPYDVFLKNMEYTEINGVSHKVELCPHIKYFSTDLQLELLTDGDLDTNISLAKKNGFEDYDPINLINYVKSQKKKKYNIDEIELILFNQLNYFSLLRKGELFLPKIVQFIDEHIEEVVSTQKYIEFINDDNDIYVGYLDFIVKFKDGITRVVDLKTASDPNKQYPSNSASNSPQLTGYAEHENIKDVAYYILDKKIRKKEPRVRDKLVLGKITDEKVEEVFEIIEESVVKIKSELFEKNWDSCYNYGGCEYYNLCRGKGMVGLIDTLKEELEE